MSVLDLVLLGAIALAVIGGYRLGLITRVVSWIGLAAGLALAVWLLPRFLDQLDTSNRGLVLVLSIGLLLVGATLGQALGFVVGGRLTPSRRDGAFGVTDRVLGGVAGFAGVIIILWLIIPVFVSGPSWLSAQTSNSLIARSVGNSLPPAPDAMQALRSVIGEGSFPEVFEPLARPLGCGLPIGGEDRRSGVFEAPGRFWFRCGARSRRHQRTCRRWRTHHDGHPRRRSPVRWCRGRLRSRT